MHTQHLNRSHTEKSTIGRFPAGHGSPDHGPVHQRHVLGSCLRRIGIASELEHFDFSITREELEADLRFGRDD